jgi:hypothetical protein
LSLATGSKLLVERHRSGDADLIGETVRSMVGAAANGLSDRL